MPLKGKTALLLAVSNGPYGGVRGLWQLRIPLEGLGVYVYPEMFPLRHAAEAFDEDGRLRDEATRDRLRKLIASYLRMGDALKQSRNDD